jgi:cyclopropane fatty-acyl-phospholipid synthase-like methyltransferase
MRNIKYYNDNANTFIEGSKDANMRQLYSIFERHVKPKGTILDLGCGSGRDSLHFIKNNCTVTSLDGSIEMVNFCRRISYNEIIHSTFEEYEPQKKFDGIWACASLLHVDKESINSVISKYINCLNVNGVFFMSFKDREEDFIKDDRVFTCFNKSGLIKCLNNFENIEIVEFIETLDVRDNRDEQKWISAIIRRVI